MTCSVCRGYNHCNCPCCGEEKEAETCPDCNGEGVIYATAEDGEVTKDYWEKHTGEKDTDICERCNSEGVIYE